MPNDSLTDRQNCCGMITHLHAMSRTTYKNNFKTRKCTIKLKQQISGVLTVSAAVKFTSKHLATQNPFSALLMYTDS